ncbi:MAG: DUF4367 domain-containing protein [Clostridiales bacterium]|nr:DUF4367 domain-containing protein [Clostridiales bacterium]
MMKEYEIALADAYGETIDREAEALAAEAEKEPHVFTKRFEERMAELIRTGKPNNRKGLSKRGRRILLIAAAAVLVLAAVACAVPEIRESIGGFFVKIFGDHVEYTDPDITRNSIEEEYGLVPIPEGFEETSVTRGDLIVISTYESSSGVSLSLIQSADPNQNDSIDNEHGEFFETEIGKKLVRIHMSDYGTQASWIEDGYYFSLVCSNNIEQNIFEEWIASVIPQ